MGESRTRGRLALAIVVGLAAVGSSAAVVALGATKTGTPKADKLVGTGKADTLRGKGGGDVIKGRRGDDLIDGGSGGDRIKGGGGNDDIEGGRGSDRAKIKDGDVDAVRCEGGKKDWVRGDDDLDVVTGCDRGSDGLVEFASDVEVAIENGALAVRSDGVPDHETGDFPGAGNPNSIQAQDYDFTLPLEPRLASSTTGLSLGPIGITVSGAPFYNPFNALGQDAVVTEVFDGCEGHPDERGRYHYHQVSSCLPSDGSGHSGVIGLAFDGFAILGPNGAGGKPPSDLDACNGHSDASRGYHYHVTAAFPYVLGCYSGEVDQGNVNTPGPPGGPPRLASGVLFALPALVLLGASVLARIPVRRRAAPRRR